jgi:3-deoxy-manno-octulosonate cytidylyltransferase (CMP-KDO synthetase)
MILGLIPSRLNSSRLKNKPLLMIDGLPIIVHTLKRAQLSKKLDKVIVCTDSKKIVNVVEKNGGEAMLTSTKHKNGTERIAEIAKRFKPKIIIDIQGDEPLVDPKDIDKVIDFHSKHKHFDIVVPSMIEKINPQSKNLVKVVFNELGKILYFSRALIPFDFRNNKPIFYKDLSIVSFLPNALRKFASTKTSYLEKVEGIELLRALENNLNLGTFIIKGNSFSVDVNHDLLRAINVMPKDTIRKRY